jgi:hypothetical protein
MSPELAAVRVPDEGLPAIQRETTVLAERGVGAADVDRVRSLVCSHRTLGDLLAWMPTRHPPLAIAEIVTQDEYTHEVVLALDERLWLAYDVT